MLLEVIVHEDCHDQDDSLGNILPGRCHIQHLQAGGQAANNQRADQGARDGANTTQW